METPLNLSNDILDEKIIVDITNSLVELNEMMVNKRVDQKSYEQSVKKTLDPLVMNGKVLHIKIIGALEESGSLSNLTNEEKEKVFHLEETQFAELSFILSFENQRSNVDIDQRIVSCLGVASGIAGVYDLIQNTSSLGTVTSATKALRLIGRRVLGWIGVGIMIIDFTNCYYGT